MGTVHIYPIQKTKGKGLEKVYLLAFGLDKVRKVPKNAETAKTTTGTVFAPSFLHASLVGGFGARPSKKKREKIRLQAIYSHAQMAAWPPEGADLF